MIGPLLALSRLELELFFKTFIAVFFTFLAPSAMFGALVAGESGDPVGAASAALPLVLGLIIVFVSLFTLAAQVVTYREVGFYKRILITRINPVGIALSNAIRGYVLVAIGAVLLSLQALAMTGSLPRVDPLGGAIAVLLAGGAIFMIGMVVASFVKKGSSMFTFATVLSYVLVFFSGAMPKTGPYTSWTVAIDRVSPSYHALKVLVAGFEGRLFAAEMIPSMFLLLVCSGLCLLIVRRYLSWM